MAALPAPPSTRAGGEEPIVDAVIVPHPSNARPMGEVGLRATPTALPQSKATPPAASGTSPVETRAPSVPTSGPATAHPSPIVAPRAPAPKTEPPEPASPVASPDAANPGEEGANHPLVKQALELFGGRIVDVQPRRL